MKYHISKTGKPAKCVAKPGTCPRGSESDHYSSLEATQLAIAAAGEKAIMTSSRKNVSTPIKSDEKYGKVGISDVFNINGKEISYNRAKELLEARKSIGRVISLRARLGDLAENKERTSAAYRRFQTLVDNAFSRGNEETMEKLQYAKMADNSFLRNEKGERVHINEVLQPASDYKRWEDNRDVAERELTKLAQDPTISPGVYNFDGVKVTVQDGAVNEKFLNSLPKDVKSSLYSEKSYIDINKAKSVLNKEEQEKLIGFSMVAEVIDNDQSRSSLSKFDASSEGTAQERFDKVASSYGSFVREAQEKVGGKTNLKKKRDEVTDLAKEEASKLNERLRKERMERDFPIYGRRPVEETTGNGSSNIVHVGSKHGTGILTSGRNFIDRRAAGAILSPEQIDAISTKTMALDLEKAKSVLSEESYSKLTSGRTIKMGEARITSPKKK